MDYRLEWSPEAAEDVEGIADFIRRDSAFYARAVVAKIVAESRSIPEFPLRGRMVPELGDEAIRELFVYSYRLVSRVEGEQILMVAVIHGKRLLESIQSRLTDSA